MPRGPLEALPLALSCYEVPSPASFFLLRGFALLERVVMDVAGGVLMHVDALYMRFWFKPRAKTRPVFQDIRLVAFRRSGLSELGVVP